MAAVATKARNGMVSSRSAGEQGHYELGGLGEGKYIVRVNVARRGMRREVVLTDPGDDAMTVRSPGLSASGGQRDGNEDRGEHGQGQGSSVHDVSHSGCGA